MVICLERGADGPADASAIPKLHLFLPHLNPDWFYLSGTHDQEKRLLNGCSSSSSSSSSHGYYGFCWSFH